MNPTRIKLSPLRLVPIVTPVLMILLTGCEVNETSEVDALSYVAESAIGGANSALNDSEQSASYAFNEVRPHWMRSFGIQTAYAAACGIARFSPPVGSSDCTASSDDKSIVSSFNDCTVGGGGYTLSGSVLLSFDSTSTCSTWIGGAGLPTSGSVTRTTQNFTRINPNGSQVVTYSTSSPNYLFQSVGGGVRTTFTAGARSVDILGLHRKRISVRGFTVFDHSVRTTTPLVVTGARAAGNRTITSGTVVLDHNRAKYSATGSISGVSWSSSCCHPVSGTISFALTGSRTGSMGVDFNTGVCGEADFTGVSGTITRVTLAACE